MLDFVFWRRNHTEKANPMSLLYNWFLIHFVYSLVWRGDIIGLKISFTEWTNSSKIVSYNCIQNTIYKMFGRCFCFLWSVCLIFDALPPSQKYISEIYFVPGFVRRGGGSSIRSIHCVQWMLTSSRRNTALWGSFLGNFVGPSLKAFYGCQNIQPAHFHSSCPALILSQKGQWMCF